MASRETEKLLESVCKGMDAEKNRMITSVERLDGYDDYDMAVCQAHIRVPNQKRVIFNFGACHMVSTMVQFLHFDDRMAETTASNNTVQGAAR